MLKNLLRSLSLFVTFSLAVFVVSETVVSEAAEADKIITPDQARQIITSGGDTSLIPKPTWKEILTPEQYRILWKKGTEKPFTGVFLNNKQSGTYVTAGCRLPVFHSGHKFKSGTGWPSFWEVVNKENVVLKKDWSWGMRRTEVLSKCGEHLGHVFEDGPDPTGLRYCINSEALAFIADEETPISVEQLNGIEELKK